jgi:hypothetical protein
MKPNVDLFQQVVSGDVAHPQFLSLSSSPLHAAVRVLINELFARMGDPDKKFVYEFQGPGFHSHLFELACFAYLEEAGFVAARTFFRPDFLVSKNGIDLALECTTANPKEGRGTDISVAGMENWTDEKLAEKVDVEFPRRVIRLLNSKLKKGYHLLPQCANKPFVLVVAPFHESGSGLYSDESVIKAFFGGALDDDQVIEPFFRYPEAKHISAILYCNAFQVSKFLRMSTDFRSLPNLTAVREGKCYVEHTESEYAFSDFRFRMTDPSIPQEDWAEGITIFENPFAEILLPAKILPCTSTISLKDGYVYRDVHGFHPLVSYMLMSIGNATEPR